MTRAASARSPRGKTLERAPAERASNDRQHAGDVSADTVSLVAEIVVRDRDDLSIDQMFRDDSPLRELLRSSKFDDIDRRTIAMLR